jgi:Acetoacetate decarboxylase (ADC)
MVDYIPRPDDPSIPPPYDFPGVTIMSFRLPANAADLQKLCDEQLNIGTLEQRGFEYRVFFDFVDMEIVTYPKMRFAEAPYSKWGCASQQEMYFRIYVWKFLSIGGLLFPDPVPEWFIPFIFVDNSWSVISGRDVIGFPKVMARFSPTPMLNADPFQICASVLALKKHTPATKLDWHPLVTINPTGAAADAAPGGLWPWIGLEAGILDPFLNELLQELLIFAPDVFSTVQLKQFRDPSNLTEACYQAIISTPFALSNLRPPQPLPPATITVDRYASIDIPKSLGFSAGVPLQPMLQFQVTLDMSMDSANTLFVNS